MIVEFSVRNYRSIKDEVTLSFEATGDQTLEDYYVVNFPNLNLRLLRLGVIYGPNASGKTNLLKALMLMREVAKNSRKRNEILSFAPFLFDEETCAEPGGLRLVFIVNGVKHVYSIVLNSTTIFEERLEYYPSRNPALMFLRKHDELTGTVSIKYGSTMKISQIEKDKIFMSTLENRSVLSAISEIELRSKGLLNVYKWFNDSFMPIIYPETELRGYTAGLASQSGKEKGCILESLRRARLKVVDFSVEDLLIDEEQAEIFLKVLPEEVRKEVLSDEGKLKMKDIKFKHAKGVLSINDESAGTQRFFDLTGPLYSCGNMNALLIIDELESSLHPELVKHILLDFLKRSEEEKKTSQLLFTTHNVSLMMEKDILRRDAIWFTDSKDDESTDLYSMADMSVRKDMSFFNAYRTGKLGAWPNLDS